MSLICDIGRERVKDKHSSSLNQITSDCYSDVNSGADLLDTQRVLVMHSQVSGVSVVKFSVDSFL
jgi:hypothetical protein